MVALADRFFAGTRIHVVMATTLFAYGVSVLIVAWDITRTRDLLVLGLIGAVPAAVCSWLSNKETDLRYRNSANGDLITVQRPQEPRK